MNQLEKIEPHASRLEAAATSMDAAGIGGHPTRGHAAILRGMAGDLRSKAAKGELPAVFDQFNAAADTGDGELSARQIRALSATSGPVSFAQAISAAGQDQNRKSNLQMLHGKLERMLSRSISASAVLDPHTLNQALDEATKAGRIRADDRWRLKSELASAGLIPA